ncbi:hypothetical protein HDU78_007999 [Chytriomyces hyalinus]|nr:hypothetical protein HDU78_007999 [Chytriomyces hyalinus]KAJ3257660.1 hypothetical protein HDU77_002633 [Chytriomyces hyalinus]
MSAEADLHKVIEKLERERATLEKELKRNKELIDLSKDRKAIAATVEENARLKAEVETLELFKNQHASLKDHMHQLAASNDEQRILVAKLTKQVVELKALVPADASVAADEATGNTELDPILKGFETTISNLRADAIKMEEELKKATEALGEEKKKAAVLEARVSNASNNNNPAPAPAPVTAAVPIVAAAAPKLWSWGKATTTSAAATTATPSASTPDLSKLEEQLKAAHAEIDALKQQVAKSAPLVASEPSPPKAAADEGSTNKKELETLQEELSTLRKKLDEANAKSAEKDQMESLLKQTQDALEKTKVEGEGHRAKLDEVDAALKLCNQEIATLTQSLEASKAETAKLEPLQSQKQQLQDTLTSTQTQLSELSANLTAQKAILESTIAESTTLKTTFESEIKTLQTEKEQLISSYESSIRSMQETIALKSLELQALQPKSANSDATADGSTPSDPQAQLSSINPLLDSLKQGYEKDKQHSAEKIAALEAKLNGLTSQLEQLKSSLHEKQKELEGSRDKFASEMSARQAELQSKDGEIAALGAQKDALMKEIEVLKGVVESGRREKVEVETRLNATMTTMIANHEAAITKQKSELEATLSSSKTVLEEQHAKEKTKLEEARDQTAKEVEKLTSEVAQLKEASSRALKESESQLKSAQDKLKTDIAALEEKHKKQMHEISETAKKTLGDLEGRMRKEFAATEEKDLKAKADEEEKKRKDLEDKFAKEKNELEQKLAKEKLKVQNELDAAKSEVDKLKKDVLSNEEQKKEQAKKFEKELFSRNDDIGKYTTRIKSLETEFDSFKSESLKTVADLNNKLSSADTTIAKLKDEIESEKQKFSTLTAELKQTQESVKQVQNKMEIVTAELEVSRSSSERLSKTNGEKDDHIKKLKQRAEDLTLTQTNMAKTITSLEKDKESLNQQIRVHGNKIADLEERMLRQKDEFEEARKAETKKVESLTSAMDNLQAANDALVMKVRDAQAEYRAMEKKWALVIKDLQRQIAKEKKRQTSSTENSSNYAADSADNLSAISDFPRSRYPSDSPNRQKPTKAISDGGHNVGIPKVERLTNELLQLAQENETLNKKTKNAEEEIRTLHDRIAKQSEELEQKSKAVQQFMLREYSNQLQPDEKASKASFSMNSLSNTSAMQKMDPLLLAQVNVKMQKLLEELTSKVMGLEEENRGLKRRDQPASTNIMVKQSNM